FGSSTVGSILSHLLLFMVLTSAAATSITAIACFWHCRELVPGGAGRAVSYVWVPLAGGVALFVLLAYSFKVYWDPDQSYFTITVFGITIGGTLVVVVLATIAGLLWMLWSMRTQAVYFSGESMRLGLSITDDDQVVRVDMDGIEH